MESIRVYDRSGKPIDLECDRNQGKPIFRVKFSTGNGNTARKILEWLDSALKSVGGDE